MRLGRIGIWRSHRHGAEVALEIERLGFDTLWVGGSPSLDDVRPFLERTTTLTVATGIVNIWRHEPAAVAAGHAQLEREFPDRFLLGLGVGHPEATSDYKRPLTAMRGFLDGLDAAADPMPPEKRVLAALAPRMLELASERSRGTHPYFTVPDHTRFARERVGPDALVAPEVAVVIDTDAESARAKAREYAKTYLRLRNYTSALLPFGFTERDIENGGSDRLIDAVIPHGSPEQIAEAVRAHLDAGADQVCVQPVGTIPAPVDDYRALAGVLL